jgi:hypothetical protein
MHTLLILNIPPSLEDDLVDYLLSLDSVGGFTSYKAMGHSEDIQLTVAEQVSGRRHRLQFEVIMEAEQVNTVTSGLAAEVGKDITYWQQPISNLGRT